MATIVEVIQNNKWKSVSFEKATEVNKLINGGIVTSASESAQTMINALDYENIQSTITVGLVDSEWAEQNLGDASDTVVSSIEPLFDEVNVKTFYGNQWWAVRTIQKDLLSASQPNKLVLNKIGGFWATQWNKIISATISGMSDIKEITVGDGTKNLTRSLLTSARKLKKDMGVGKLADAYMSSTTLFDIIDKQDAGTIPEIITEKYGTVTVVKDGITQVVQSDVPEYVLNKVTPISVDDTMKDGIISLVEDNAFAFAQKNIKDPIMYDNSPKAGNGAGKEEYGTKSLYIMHPIGFSFKGSLEDGDYASKSGLTLAELQGGGLYELKVDAKLAPITNLKVKIGA